MEEQTVYGLKAVLALIEKRPRDILRLFYRGDRIPALKHIFAWLAVERLIYRQVEDEDLRKLAAGQHHEGVVLVAQPLRYTALPAGPLPPGGWVALDGVDNPHNLGAILRSASFFGAAGVLVGGVKPEEKVNAAVLRVSEGGAEHLQLCGVPDLAAMLTAVKAQAPVLGLETDAKRALREAAPAPTFVLAVGNEQTGLTTAVRRACTAYYSIPGAGRVGSLNVSVATGIALAQLLPGK